MNTPGIRSFASLVLVSALAGCGAEPDNVPPEVRLGDSVCAECGMIISDARFATSTVIDGDRGREPLVFDDFNCQMSYETKHADMTIITRWSHDHTTMEWFPTQDAWFVRSDQLRTPMASQLAAFSSQEKAEAFVDQAGGESISFRNLWNGIE